MTIPVSIPHRVTDAMTGQTTVYLGVVSFKAGPAQAAPPQPAKER